MLWMCLQTLLPMNADVARGPVVNQKIQLSRRQLLILASNSIVAALHGWRY